jgi:hypothetical protein
MQQIARDHEQNGGMIIAKELPGPGCGQKKQRNDCDADMNPNLLFSISNSKSSELSSYIIYI